VSRKLTDERAKRRVQRGEPMTNRSDKRTESRCQFCNMPILGDNQVCPNANNKWCVAAEPSPQEIAGPSERCPTCTSPEPETAYWPEAPYPQSVRPCSDNWHRRMARSTRWLIESNWKSPKNNPMWLRLFGYVSDGKRQLPKPEWTEDVELALGFARKSDAEWFALLYPEMCCLAKITEHIFGLTGG